MTFPFSFLKSGRWGGAIAMLLLGLVLTLLQAIPGATLSAGSMLEGVAVPFTLPFSLVNSYILVPGDVNGVKGKFLFDTGTPFGFFINSHRVALAPDEFLASGAARSSQPFDIYRQRAPIDSLSLAEAVRYEDLVAGVVHSPGWRFAEDGITPDFLGSVGHEFNQQALFAIDYEHQVIQFYPFEQAADILQAAAANGQMIAVLPFTAEGDGRKPELDFQLGDVVLHGVFDTGNAGEITLTPAARAQLEAAGYLTVRDHVFFHGLREASTRATIRGLMVAGQPLGDVHSLEIKTGEMNEIWMGYAFLKQYITLWNYRDRTLALLRP